MDDGNVGWLDQATISPVRAELSQLHLSAKQIDLNAAKPMQVALVTRVGAGRTEPGRLSWRGQIGLQPAVSAQGEVDAVRLPLHALDPYFGDALNIDILRADTSFKGNVNFTQTAQGPRARVSGDALIEELRTYSVPGTAASGDTEPTAAAGTPPSTTHRNLGGSTTTTATAPSRPPPATPATPATTAASAASTAKAKARNSATINAKTNAGNANHPSASHAPLAPCRPAPPAARAAWARNSPAGSSCAWAASMCSWSPASPRRWMSKTRS